MASTRPLYVCLQKPPTLLRASVLSLSRHLATPLRRFSTQSICRLIILPETETDKFPSSQSFWIDQRQNWLTLSPWLLYVCPSFRESSAFYYQNVRTLPIRLSGSRGFQHPAVSTSVAARDVVRPAVLPLHAVEAAAKRGRHTFGSIQTMLRW